MRSSAAHPDLQPERWRAARNKMVRVTCTPPARRQGGFTYVEVLVASAIMTVVAGVSIVMVESGRQMWLTTDANLNSLENGQIALNRLGEDVR